LLGILVFAWLLGVIAIIALSRWMAYLAYRPFNKVIDQVKNITTHNLNVKIDSPETHDELQNLTDTFNDLLQKISESFVIQKNFVNYVSHEFKTPLASMLGNLEVFALKDRKADEYHQLSEKLIYQIHQLEDILNTLIIISDLRENTDTNTSVRTDELIWEIINKIKENYPLAKILVNISIEPEDENLLLIPHSRIQLLMALFNIIENSVKYSKGKPVEINLFKEENTLRVRISDQGIGIPEEQLEHIRKPFYRAENTHSIQGNGIGFSIALRILEKNGIRSEINSKVNVGTTIEIIF